MGNFMKVNAGMVRTLLLIVTLGFSAFTFATPVACVPNTPMSVLQTNGGCLIGNELFSNFVLFPTEANFGTFNSQNILVTATATSLTFTTDWGPEGAWTKRDEGDQVIEMGMGYDVEFQNAFQTFSSVDLLAGMPDVGGREQITCYGRGNTATPAPTGQQGYTPLDIPSVCADPSAAAYIANGDTNPSLFSPTTPALHIAISLNQCCEGGLPLGTVIYPYVRNDFGVVEAIAEPGIASMLAPIMIFAGWRIRKRTSRWNHN
jgi:hypothetical protein